MTTSPEPLVSESSEPPPEEARIEAGIYASAVEGFEHGLVALAMGCPYWLEEGEDGYRLFVPAAAAAGVREQLRIFARENLRWPPPRLRETPAPVGRFSAALFPSALWALVVLAVFAAQGAWPGLVEAGAMDARAFFADGEWWRAATALFLHADLGHVSSNVIGGVFLFSTVLATFGRARGACLLALSSVAGNLAAAAIHWPKDYRSLGASTAVFAALGMLTGRAVRTVT
ncbi:MAG: rhomboid family intramembrane serine protease, partial [Burkholderiales bacterium]|nr:rhomboid family intramembrane serine protease [Opitutaceae bacterium]